jgi:hypothetical protein
MLLGRITVLYKAKKSSGGTKAICDDDHQTAIIDFK